MGSVELRLRGLKLDRWTAALIAICAACIFLVGYFDLQTHLAIADEFARRWTIQQLVAGHGIQPWGSSPSFVQMFLAAIPAELGTDPRYWRLVQLPFLASEAFFTAVLARRLGADWFWSALAGTALLCCPLNMTVATGMQTEIVFLGLFMPGLWSALRWVEDGKAIAWTVVLTLLAVSQRQQGAAILLVVVVGLVATGRRRSLSRADILGLVGMLVAVVAILQLNNAVRAHSIANQHDAGASVPHQSGPIFDFYALAAVGPMLGLLALPFASGLLSRVKAVRPPRRNTLLPAIVGLVGIMASLGIAQGNRPGGIFPGPFFTALGLGPEELMGKPQLFGPPTFIVVEVLTIATIILALIWRRADWDPRFLGTPGALLVLCASIQLPAIFYEGQALDRYYLILGAPLLPIIAAAASRTASKPRLARSWALAVLLGALGMYLVGEQDYIASREARAAVARMAYGQVAAPWQVDAGGEENADNVYIPAENSPPGRLQGVMDEHPRLRLAFGPTSDPRPGSNYNSLVPGRVIIIPGDAPAR